MKRTKLSLFLVPISVVTLLFGTAFSIFYFGSTTVEKENKVNINVTNNNDFGTFNLVTYENGKYVDEIKDTPYQTKFF